MSTTTPVLKNSVRPFAKYLVLYLALTIGSVWALTIVYLLNTEAATRILGELQLTNPVVIIVLHSPAIAALIIFYWYDGLRGVRNFFLTLLPRKKDLQWIPILIGLMIAYIFAVRYLCLLLGIPVPADPQTPPQMVATFFRLFVMEIGMVAITIGWFGFFLPFMHRVTDSHLVAGIATGVGIGVFVAPGNLFASFELASAWPLYVTQLCVLCVGMSLLLTLRKGNVLFFLLPFWVSASGSQMRLYYFKTATQIVQLTLFTALVVVLYSVVKRQERRAPITRYVFPDYIERAYTVGVGAVIPGSGDRSLEILAAHQPRKPSEKTAMEEKL